MKSEERKPERLQKILAAAGIASRRKCETFIEEGRVTVDGRTSRLGEKADPATQDIRLDGKRVKPERKVYYLLNKPRGYVCSSKDEFSRKTIYALVPETGVRLFSIGRLDRDSEGLIIITNDGDFAQRIGHPSRGLEKEYYVEIEGSFRPEDITVLKKGVMLDGRRTRVARCRIIRTSRTRSALSISLVEGRKREIRRMLKTIGYDVSKLVRIRIGPVKIEGLKSGKTRKLSDKEIEALLETSKP
jgi:23S rRNA pseudouridine2605 synthase